MEVRMRQEASLPLIDADDPFGADTATENLPPPAAPGYGKVSGIKGKGSPFKAREHYPRVRKALEEKHGGFFWNCDRKQVRYDGSIYDQDLLGFMDIQGVSGGRFIACNVTTQTSIKDHLRKYTDPRNTYGQGKLSVYSLLLEFLKNGGEFWIYGGYKDGRLWRYETVRVTAELLGEYVARKRGGKG
jgi:hypothetical protein